MFLRVMFFCSHVLSKHWEYRVAKVVPRLSSSKNTVSAIVVSLGETQGMLNKPVRFTKRKWPKISSGG